MKTNSDSDRLLAISQHPLENIRFANAVLNAEI